ncbi:hypothetical protein JOC55_000283 [Paenibacillus sacheonensis]|nr:hypothetical protein [Paenibacillus sacheonensis]
MGHVLNSLATESEFADNKINLRHLGKPTCVKRIQFRSWKHFRLQVISN